MALSRRDFLTTSGAMAAGLMVSTSFVGSAQAADSVELSKLLEKGPLPDKVLGSEDAPVTMIEYSSLTCPHCAAFHNGTFKHLKENYIDKGKMRYIAREFPLDPLAFAGAMLARCAPNDNFYPMTDLMFETQRTWAASPNPVQALEKMAKQVGFTQESFTECLTNQKLLDDITAVRERGSKEFGINSTPTFFINGEKQVGALSVEEIDKILAPMLK